MRMIWDLIDHRPRLLLLGVALSGLALLVFGMYLQHVVGLEPCPMCIVQRYALMGVVLAAGLAACFKGGAGLMTGTAFMGLFAGFGGFTAARQSWLQWYPPEILTCGRDFFGMIEAFPLRRALPMIFRGSGDCSKVDWSFLGLTIANWSFLWFLGFLVLAVLIVWRAPRAQRLALS